MDFFRMFVCGVGLGGFIVVFDGLLGSSDLEEVEESFLRNFGLISDLDGDLVGGSGLGFRSDFDKDLVGGSGGLGVRKFRSDLVGSEMEFVRLVALASLGDLYEGDRLSRTKLFALLSGKSVGLLRLSPPTRETTSFLSGWSLFEVVDDDDDVVDDGRSPGRM